MPASVTVPRAAMTLSVSAVQCVSANEGGTTIAAPGAALAPPANGTNASRDSAPSTSRDLAMAPRRPECEAVSLDDEHRRRVRRGNVEAQPLAESRSGRGRRGDRVAALSRGIEVEVRDTGCCCLPRRGTGECGCTRARAGAVERDDRHSVVPLLCVIREGDV